MGVKHSFTSTAPASPNPALIDGPKWNAAHTYVDAAGNPTIAGALLVSGGPGPITHAVNVVAGDQLIAVYRTSAGANYERLMVTWEDSAAVIATQAGGTGAPRDLVFGTEGPARVVIKTANTYRWVVDAGGHLLAVTDNAYDIGAAGANRPRHLHVAGTITAATIAATSITLGGVAIDAPELGYLDGVTPGAVLASKAVVVDANNDIAGFRHVTTTGAITAASMVVGGVTLVPAELGYIDGITPGTVLASKAVVVDANKDIASVRNLTAAVFKGSDPTGTLISNDVQVVANNAAISLGTTATIGYLFVVNQTDQVVGLFSILGTNIVTVEVNDTAGAFSAVAGTVNSVNVYWSATNSRYELENKRGGARTIRLMRIGI